MSCIMFEFSWSIQFNDKFHFFHRYWPWQEAADWMFRLNWTQRRCSDVSSLGKVKGESWYAVFIVGKYRDVFGIVSLGASWWSRELKNNTEKFK